MRKARSFDGVPQDDDEQHFAPSRSGREQQLPPSSAAHQSHAADALSLEAPRRRPHERRHEAGDEDDERAFLARHRRVKSFDAEPLWGPTDPIPRDRTYTKSLGNLTPLSPRFVSPIGRMHMMRSLPKIWSPRSDGGAAEAPAVDYRIKYEFALILHNKPTTPRILARNGLDAAGKQQMAIGAVGEVPSEIEQLIAASDIGALHAHRRDNDKGDNDNGKRAVRHRRHQDKQECCDVGAADSDDPNAAATAATTAVEALRPPALATIDDDSKFTPAERIQTIARIITSTADVEHLNPPGAAIAVEEDSRNDAIIASCFPLHNQRVNSMLLDKCGRWWGKSSEITSELRYYYGERVAFYFSFVFLYTKCLLVPALGGSAVYFACRWLGAVTYMRALCIFGFCAATLWGAWFLKAWRRKNHLLNDAWNLRLFKEAEYPNSTFKPQGYRNVVDSHGVVLFQEPYYNPIFRVPAYLQTFVVFTLFIVTYVLGITFFVQWYTAAMMAPVCTKCPTCVAFLSCFDTERPTLFSWRWCYILAQGVLLGISLDVFVYLLSVKLIHFFVVRENHATEAHFQRTMINRLFVINWISFFLWFILIAFVIVPFGQEVEAWLADKFKYTKLAVDWENGVIDMSTALVTPLLITQALNLLIDTAVPYLFRRETLKASKLARKIMRANPAETLLALSEYQSSFENVVPGVGPAAQGAASVDFKVKMELQMLTPIRIPYIEKALGVSINTLEGFENEKIFMTADDVLEESQLALYNAFPDYLRMVIQYGYVVMFSVVWPFCALAAFANNLVHIRNGFNKLVLLRRRPVPRKSNSIGQWEKMLFITLILAVFVVVGLICVSSGELEYFLTQCTSLERFNGKDFSMNPDFSCVDLSSRFLVALVLEHAALLLVFLVMDNISDTPATVRTSFQRKKELIRRAICGHGKSVVPSAPSAPSTPGADYSALLGSSLGTSSSSFEHA
ncbi:hypothetical protein PybrP1_004501 [[Pythium] brassicae (nom. inval.)]|nr:hypothetical protein PybrP1_004501 [[Pythium] brassicae (nom. inval.)]